MSFTYNPLWKILIDRNMTKEELRNALNFSPSTIAKMGKCENVSMEVLDRICNYFGCKIDDVVAHIPEEKGVPVNEGGISNGAK